MCVSTHEYHLMLGKNIILQLESTEKPCYYPPPTAEPCRLLETTDIFCYYPPPTESRRLLEITEKTQEIQQPQLGSSSILLP